MNRTLLLGSRRKCLPPGAVALYLFNEGSGQVLTDYSGNGNHGILGSELGEDTNDPTWTGRGAKCITDDLIMVPISMFMPMTAITGILAVTFENASQWDCIAAAGNSGNEDVYSIILGHSRNLYVVVRDSEAFTGAYSGVIMETNQTALIGFSYSADTGLRIYIDDTTIQAVAPNGRPLAPRYSQFPIRCGFGYAAAQTSNVTFHSVAFYDRVVTPAEIARVYNVIKADCAAKGVVLP